MAGLICTSSINTLHHFCIPFMYAMAFDTTSRHSFSDWTCCRIICELISLMAKYKCFSKHCMHVSHADKDLWFVDIPRRYTSSLLVYLQSSPAGSINILSGMTGHHYSPTGSIVSRLENIFLLRLLNRDAALPTTI